MLINDLAALDPFQTSGAPSSWMKVLAPERANVEQPMSAFHMTICLRLQKDSIVDPKRLVIAFPCPVNALASFIIIRNFGPGRDFVG